MLCRDRRDTNTVVGMMPIPLKEGVTPAIAIGTSLPHMHRGETTSASPYLRNPQGEAAGAG